jgi:opacity protein-like surface antigen
MRRVLFAMMLLFPALSQAQEATAEITAFGAYRFGGTFEEEATEAKYELTDSPSFGLILNLRHQDPTQWEIFYSQQQTEAEFFGATANDPEVDVDLHVLQLGGTYQWDGEVARPYLAFTLGGTHVRTSSTESRSDTFFSGSIGVGMKFLPTSRVGIRVEARAYGTLVDSSTDLFCSTGPDANICAIRLEGKMLSQVETFAGITVRF